MHRALLRMARMKARGCIPSSVCRRVKAGCTIDTSLSGMRAVRASPNHFGIQTTILLACNRATKQEITRSLAASRLAASKLAGRAFNAGFAAVGTCTRFVTPEICQSSP